MTNIFSRKPSTNLPAKRYEQFISVFEKHVSEVQKKIARVQKLEGVYNVVRSVMEKAQIPNDSDIRIDADGVYVTIIAVETDRMEMFELLQEKMGHALVEAKIKDKPRSASRKGGYWHHMSWQWYLSREIGEPSRQVHLEVRMPAGGIADIAIIEKRTEYTSYNIEYEYVERSKSIEGNVL